MHPLWVEVSVTFNGTLVHLMVDPRVTLWTRCASICT